MWSPSLRATCKSFHYTAMLFERCHHQSLCEKWPEFWWTDDRWLSVTIIITASLLTQTKLHGFRKWNRGRNCISQQLWDLLRRSRHRETHTIHGIQKRIRKCQGAVWDFVSDGKEEKTIPNAPTSYVRTCAGLCSRERSSIYLLRVYG